MVNRELFPERKSVERLAFEFWLRTGQRLTTAEWRCIHERKYNANHDPQNGQFTFGPSGSVPDSGGGGANRGSRDRAATGSTPGAQTQQVRIPAPVKPDHIRAVMPYAGALADAYEKPLNEAMAAHGIDTPEQRAAFLAQIAVESGHLRRTAENLNYSAERIVQVWPKRFPTIASAKPYAHNPAALANQVYGNRMGNTGITGGGFRYRGRGLIQVTGHDQYRQIGFENNPDALAQPQVAAESAAAYWQANNLHTRTRGELNRQQFDTITRTVNKGGLGSDERWAAYQRALAVLKPKGPARQ